MKRLWNNNALRKSLCVLLAACLLVGLFANLPIFAPVSAAAAALKEEVIYVRLHSDGSVDEIYVVNSFTLDMNREIIDYGNYSHVQNLSNMDVVRLADGIVTIDTQDDKLYYEGFLMDAQLPWEFTISYRLDGKEIRPEELGGKSGLLKLEISSAFNPRGNREFFDRYCLQVAVSLDSSICRNITADAGTIAAAGGNRQINFIVFPGKETVMELSTDVTDFKMPSITIAGVTMNMDFDFDDVDMSDIQELIDGLIELDDGVQELLDGIFEMRDGVRELYDGSVEFADGMGEFEEGVFELKDGVGELKDGTLELKDGVEELKDGVIELADGTQELKDGVIELRDGVYEMADGMDEMVEGLDELVDGVREFDDGIVEFKDGIFELYSGVKELLEGTQKLYDGIVEIYDGAVEMRRGMTDFASGTSLVSGGGSQLYYGFVAYFDALLQMANAQLEAFGITSPPLPLTSNNYESVLTGLIAGPALSIARAQFESMVEAGTRAQILAIAVAEAQAASGGMLPDDLDYWPGYMKDMIEAAVNAQMSSPQVLEAIRLEVDALMDAYREDIVDEALNNPAAAPLMELYIMLDGYETLLAGLRAFISGGSQIGSGASYLSGGMVLFVDGLKEYKEGMGEYLEGMEEFHDGTVELVTGARKLADGSRELLDGMIELRDGVLEFRDGVIELRDGVIELCDGIVELHDGVIELRDGVIELNDGVIELNDGVIELYDGVIELHDGTIELLDGAIEFRDGISELYDGTSELYDGVSELKDGTAEIRENTETLDTDIIDGIKDTVEEMMGGEGPVNSFVSERNGEIDAVQFVMQTEGISRPEQEKPAPPEVVETTFWQRFLALFGVAS